MTTTNKGLNTPAYNSNINTWDVPVNENTTILDQALGSVTSLSAAGSVGTINLTAAQYRSLIISVTGVMTGVAEYVIPSGVGGQWIIVNGTTGAYNLTISNAAGGDEVVCEQGKTSLVYSDGTNIRLSDDRALSDLPSSFPAGTAMLFQQTAAPTGWTKDTTHNNKALRVVSGSASSGGTVAFTTAFASQSVAGTVGNTTLTVDQMPSHAHTGIVVAGSIESGVSAIAATTSGSTSSIGGDQSHTHTFTGTAINLAVQYVDLIIATKDA